MSAMTAQSIIIVGSGGSVAAAGLLKNPNRRQTRIARFGSRMHACPYRDGCVGAHLRRLPPPLRLGSRRLDSEFARDGQSVECRQHDDLDPVIACNVVVEGPERLGVVVSVVLIDNPPAPEHVVRQ